MIIDFMSGYGIFIFAFALIGACLYIKNDMLKIRNGAALPESFSVAALSEAGARNYLVKDADLYVSEFGEPETA